MKEEVSSETFFIIPKTVGLIFLVCLCYWVRIQGGIYRLRPCLCSLSERKNLELVAFVIQLVRGLWAYGSLHWCTVHTISFLFHTSYPHSLIAVTRQLWHQKKCSFGIPNFWKTAAGIVWFPPESFRLEAQLIWVKATRIEGRGRSQTVPFSISQIDIYKEPGSLI